jgi:hypothetical protein
MNPLNILVNVVLASLQGFQPFAVITLWESVMKIGTSLTFH